MAQLYSNETERRDNMPYCTHCGTEVSEGAQFCPKCGAPITTPTDIGVKSGTEAAKELTGDISPKSRIAATLFAWFLGIFGAHRFYVGKTGTAVTMLVLGLIGFATLWLFVGEIFLIAVGIWAFVDFIIAVTGNMRDKEGKLIQKW
jgi:TM2 domain-containing membrane protein YozV